MKWKAITGTNAGWDKVAAAAAAPAAQVEAAAAPAAWVEAAAPPAAPAAAEPLAVAAPAVGEAAAAQVVEAAAAREHMGRMVELREFCCTKGLEDTTRLVTVDGITQVGVTSEA